VFVLRFGRYGFQNNSLLIIPEVDTNSLILNETPTTNSRLTSCIMSYTYLYILKFTILC